MPGLRPKDMVGVKAMAITAQRAFAGAAAQRRKKVLAGAPVIEHGMVEEDFQARNGGGGRASCWEKSGSAA